MPKPETQKSSVKVDIGARAEARFEVKADVPPSSVGRFVDALTDLFRPISEARGLRADQIRLQREEVAIEIARLARRKAEIEKVELTSPPLKVLIPLFERASQERPDDSFIIDMWSNLLVSASTQDSIPPRFVSILGEINGRQARLFIDIVTKNSEDVEHPHQYPEQATFDFHIQRFEEAITFLLKSRTLKIEDVYERLLPLFEVPGVALNDLIVDSSMRGSSIKTDENRFGPASVVSDLQILKSLGLLQGVEIYRTKRSAKKSHVNSIAVIYFHVTEMGCDFYRSVDRSTRAGR